MSRLFKAFAAAGLLCAAGAAHGQELAGPNRS